MSAQLTCLSALHALDLPLLEDYAGLHLSIPAHRGFVQGDPRMREGFRFHRTEAPLGRNVIAPVPDVLDHLGMCAAPLTQLAAIDAALHGGLLSTDDISKFTATPLRRRLWLRKHAEPLTQSPRETKLRLELRGAGLAAEPQAKVPGLGHVDFLVERNVVVECDGFNYHNDEEAFTEDRRRDRVCELLGLSRLRYTGEEVLISTGEIAAQVKQMLVNRERQSRVRVTGVTGVTLARP